MSIERTIHRVLDCGIELAALQLPKRRAVACELRFLAGAADEPADLLGVAHLVSETVDKGTARRDARELADAFDVIGASYGSWVGREGSGYHFLCLPEFFDTAVSLHAEFLRTPTFPEESCQVAVELTRQEISALEDDPQALADKLVSRRGYGPVLGRHTLGERETLERIDRQAIIGHWRETYEAGRMLAAVAGPLEPEAVADALDRHFEGFGAASPAGRKRRAVEFSCGAWHHPKETQQQQIGLCYPGVPIDHADYAIERVALGILSGGMSARLFTEVREKQGLVYWVSAWHEHPRGSGMIFVGASTTPERCDQTYQTLLRELDRLGEDVTEEEIIRAKTGILVRSDVASDVTRSRCSEIMDDLFHFGRPLPREEKLDDVRAVTLRDVKRYLAEHPRNGMCVVTLGPRELSLEVGMGSCK